MDNWPFEDARVLSFDLLHVDTGRVSNASPSSTNLLPPPRRTTVAIALSRFFDGLTNYGSRYRYFRCRAFDILLFRSGTSGRATFKERYKAATASFYRSLGFDRIYLPSRLVVFIDIVFFAGDNPLSMPSSFPCQYVAWANSFTASLFANRSPVFRILYFSASPAFSPVLDLTL